MHMIDVMTKLKEIADSGYDNEDIQRGITAASKHQVNEDVQSEYKELLSSLKGQNERKRAKMLADFADKHKLDGMYDPESGYFVYSGDEGPEIAGSGSMKALKALDAMGLVPDSVRAAKGLPPKETPAAKPSGGDADPAGMTGADAAATRPNPTTASDFGGDDTPDDEPETAPSVGAAPNPTATNFGGDDTPDDEPDRDVEVIDLPPVTAGGADDDDDNERIDPAMPPSGPAGVGASIRKGKYNRDAIKMDEIEEVHESVEEDTGLEDILRLAGRSGVLGMNKPISIVAESLELDEEEVVGEAEVDLEECPMEEEAVEETVEVPVSTLADLMRLAGYTDYQEQVEEYANDPAEEYMDAEDQLIGLSGGMNGPKKMYPAAAGGDNPMDQEPREIEEVAEAEEDFTSSFYKKYDAFLESLNQDN